MSRSNPPRSTVLTMNNDYFAFEVAERMLDAWCFSQDRTFSFRRCYRKLKLIVAAIAVCDHMDANAKKLTPKALSRGWEELQVACTGYGEDAITGPIRQLFNNTPEEDEETLLALFEAAFIAADALTGPDVRRLFPSKHRKKPFIELTRENVENAVPVLPYSGTRLKEYAHEMNLDYELIALAHEDEEQEYRELEMKERRERGSAGAEEASRTSVPGVKSGSVMNKGLHLRLVEEEA